VLCFFFFPRDALFSLLPLLPGVGLRTGWQVEVREDGAVRLWLQTEPLSAAAELRLILNDREIASSAPVRETPLSSSSGNKSARKPNETYYTLPPEAFIPEGREASAK